MSNSFTAELEFATNIIKEASRLYIKVREAPTNVYQKGEFDHVTSTDYAIEKFLVDQLAQKFPTDRIISEETLIAEITDDRTWVIDPLDGTSNYARKIPIYGIQMALLINKQPVVAVIYLPELEEMYSAAVNQGSYLNGKRIYVNVCRDLSQAIVSMGDFSKGSDRALKNRVRLAGVCAIANHIGRLKMWGAACYDLAFLASGKTDAYLVYSYNIWDIMPGYLIAKEAGAVFQQLTGEAFDYTATTLIGAANIELMNGLLELIN
ncbi:inositol monophosphatase [Phormidium sp. LEGE 05292]|uniref:inositol monophosphatase family protein n=1 Tax=[Phormidium] sp. LEGE 05292 TaxID=767427 RepID=UPI00187F8764|nr:inositol monophosphatase family protein [Phormidium sp. LEGE 05292]MBE9228847.1 inositol monophosphatase [Phormidium sp. LEGE 05292]